MLLRLPFLVPFSLLFGWLLSLAVDVFWALVAKMSSISTLKTARFVGIYFLFNEFWCPTIVHRYCDKWSDYASAKGFRGVTNTALYRSVMEYSTIQSLATSKSIFLFQEEYKRNATTLSRFFVLHDCNPNKGSVC